MNGSRPAVRSMARIRFPGDDRKRVLRVPIMGPSMRRGDPRARRAHASARTTKGPSVVLVLDLLGVGVGVEQFIQLAAIADAHGEDPAVAEGILVDRLGLVVE